MKLLSNPCDVSFNYIKDNLYSATESFEHHASSVTVRKSVTVRIVLIQFK